MLASSGENPSHREYLTRLTPRNIDPSKIDSLYDGKGQTILYQVHSGKVGVEDFVNFVHNAPSHIPIGIDLSQKRRLRLNAELSLAETAIRYKYGSTTDLDYGPSQIVANGDSVFIRTNPNVALSAYTYDHVLDLATNLNTSTIVKGSKMGIGARAKMEVEEITPDGIKGQIVSCNPNKPKLYDLDGFVSPSSIQLRVQGEDQFSDVDLDYLRSVPEEERGKLTNVAISFAHDPDKIRKAMAQVKGLGYRNVRFDLKVETLEAVRNLESFATIEGVNIVFACGDLGEAAEEAGIDLEDVVKSSVVQLRNLRQKGMFQGHVSLAHGFAEEKADRKISKANKIQADKKFAFHANIENLLGESIGIWHTGIGMKQESAEDLRRIVEGTVYGSASQRVIMEQKIRGVLDGTITKGKEIRLHPASVGELRGIFFAKRYGFRADMEHEWMHRTEVMFDELYGRHGEGCQTILRINRRGNLTKENTSVFLRIYHTDEKTGEKMELIEEQILYDDNGKEKVAPNHLGIPGEKKSGSESEIDACMRLMFEELGIVHEYGTREYAEFAQRILKAEGVRQGFVTRKRSNKYFGIPSKYQSYYYEIELPKEMCKENYEEYDDLGRVKSRFRWVKYRGNDLYQKLQHPKKIN